MAALLDFSPLPPHAETGRNKRNPWYSQVASTLCFVHVALQLPWLADRIRMPPRGAACATRHAVRHAQLLLIVVLAARAVMGQPPLLPWQNSSKCRSGYDFCATLEFCSTSTPRFGYRIPGSGVACGTFGSAPVIRMMPGKKYALTLFNNSSSATNLHTHGLHISGDGNSDDTSARSVTGGQCLIYTYNIPGDHMGGTFWYHAHLHQQTNTQVSRGAFGMLIIEDQPNLATDTGVVNWLKNERLLLASSIDGVNGATIYRGNGVINTKLPQIIAGEWYRLRVVTVKPVAEAGEIEVGGSACGVRAVAYDGVWRTSIPHPTDTNVYRTTGASRIDLAVNCSSGIHTISWNGGLVASLNATNGIRTGATPYINNIAWSPPRPAYLQDLRNTSVDNSFTVHVSANSINDVGWNVIVPLAMMQYNTTQEWEINAFGGAHNFHLHVYHVQVVTLGGCEDGQFEEGEWYDVITGEPCLVRFRTLDYGGRVVLHCHVLAHGDDGAMGWINVTGACHRQDPPQPNNLPDARSNGDADAKTNDK